MRRAPKKGERPEHIRAIHEEAAEHCARNLFSEDENDTWGCPAPFTLTVPQPQA
jgi:hypothetical protein